MSLDIQKLQNLYKSDAVSRAILDTLNDEGASQYHEVTEFGGGFLNGTAFADLDEKRRAQEIIKALKAIERTGCGTFITGREGKSSSMSWDLEPEEIYAFAIGGGEPLTEVEVATLPEPPPARRGGRGRGQRPAAGGGPAVSRFPKLDTCIEFFSTTKSWPAPVVAAAQAGLWEDDVAPPEW